MIFQYFVTDTLNESLQHYRAKAKTHCAKSKALSYYLDFMFSHKLELGRVTLGSEITWENWHSRCAQVHPTIMSMWTCFQKTNISIHTFFFLFQKWKLCQIAYRIFSVYQENTKTIHLIMMIWLVIFTISNYKLASGPPKDPGGVKKIFSKSKDIDS